MPDGTEAAFLKEWARKKLLSLLDQNKFDSISEFSRLVAYPILLLEAEMVMSVGEMWLYYRTLDICATVRELRRLDMDSVSAGKVEEQLIELLTFVAEYREINGLGSPYESMVLSNYAYKIPKGWKYLD
jgi:hypothetical protein